MVYLFITKDNKVEHFADKEDAQRLYGYNTPDKIITDEEYDKSEGLFRIINGQIFMGKTDEEKKEELSIIVREKRNSYLTKTDKYMLPDYPISKSELDEIIKYRQTLRDLPENKNFPYLEVPELKEK